MKFLPWNRLQLSSDIDNRNRVFKQQVSFRLYRTYRVKVSWSSFFYNNLALFYGDNQHEKELFIRNMAHQSRRFSASSEIALFDLHDCMSDLGEELETEYPSFQYHPYKASLFSLLGDLLKLREEIKTKTRKLGLIETSSRKLLFVLLPLNTDDLHILRNDTPARTAFKSLLQNSSNERIYMVPVVAQASTFPKELEKELHWAVYLGESNSNHCRNVAHSTMRDGHYSILQTIIGVAYFRNQDRLVILHPLEFTPSQYYIEREEQWRREDEAYAKFLDTLDDGTKERHNNGT